MPTPSTTTSLADGGYRHSAPASATPSGITRLPSAIPDAGRTPEPDGRAVASIALTPRSVEAAPVRSTEESAVRARQPVHLGALVGVPPQGAAALGREPRRHSVVAQHALDRGGDGR